MDLKIKENTQENTTEEKSVNQVMDKVLKLTEMRLNYLIERHESKAEQDKQEAFGLIKTDELIKLAKLLKEFETGEKSQGDSDENDDEQVRFVLDKGVRRFAK